MLTKWRHVIALAGFVLLGGITGCADPRAVAPTRARLNKIDTDLTRFVEREQDGPRRLAEMEDLVEKDRRWHDELLARDLKRVKSWSEGDCQRWQERQPVYRADLADQLDGNLKQAYDTIPRLFY